MKVLHAWLKDYMGNGTPSVAEIERLLTFNAFEIDGVERVGAHDVIDVKILPSRSSDCLSHRGIARELAALTATPLASDPFSGHPELPPTEHIHITIADPVACRQFALALISGVKVGPSPKWLEERLVALGQRSINNIVDATNYVMFALGQPLHAYDARKFEKSVDGAWHIGVRFARGGERITVLGGETYELDSSVQVIVNSVTDTPAGIAGVKGGAYAAIDESTSTLLVEAANFDPSTTRRAAQKIRLQTDASKRFENNISPGVVPFALSEVVKLIIELAGGTNDGCAMGGAQVTDNAPVRLRRTKAEALLGMSLEDATIERILGALGFNVASPEPGVFDVVAPFERTDINIEEDVIEEVGRIVGYDKIVAVIPEPVSLVEFNARHYYSEVVRDTLTSLGFSEVITSTFRKKDEIQLQNALASDKSYLRSRLSVNISEALAKNAPFVDLLGATDTRIFEIGTVFKKSAAGVVEHVSLALGVRIKPGGYSPKDDAALLATITLLEKALGVPLESSMSTGIAEVDLSALIAKLPPPTQYDPVPKSESVTYEPFSVFPAVSRDIALFVGEETKVSEVGMLIDAHAGALRIRTTLFDTFTKDGRTSYAFRIVFQAPDRTLTDEEVNERMERIYIAARAQGWEIR